MQDPVGQLVPAIQPITVFGGWLVPSEDIVVRLVADDSELQAGLDRGSAAVSGFGAMVASGVMQAGAAFSNLGNRIDGATSQMTSTFKTIETGWAEVSTLLDDNVDASATYGDAVARLSQELGAQGGEVEVLRGLYQTLSASMGEGEDATTFLETAMKAATAGLSDTETSVDALSTIVNSYGLTAQDAAHISDLMFMTIKRGKTTFNELAPQIGNVTNLAAQSGVSFEELSAATATLTRAGIKTDRAVTGLRQTIVQFLAPSTAMQDAVRALGYESADTMLRQEGLAGSLRKLMDHVGGNTAAFQKLFPNVRALNVALPLAGEQAGAFAGDLRLMAGASGAAEAAFAKMADTTSFKQRQLANELEQAKKQFGESMIGAENFAKTLETKLYRALASLPAPIRDTVGGLALFTGKIFGTIGPILQFIGQLMMLKVMLGMQAAMAGTAATANAGLAASFWAMLGPIALIAAAIIGIILVLKNLDKIVGALRMAWGGLKKAGHALWG